MRNISEMNVIQIEATNSCNNNCANCTRFCGHYTSDKIFWATLEDIEAALVSLKDYQHVVGLIGGEPTLHPLFEEITMLYKKYRPRIQCGLWSNGSTKQYRQYKSLIDEVYYIRNINDHKSNVIHTPMLVSADSLSKSNEEKKSFFDNCWVQMTWSATVTPRGGYFCEVAGMLSWLFDGPEGRKIRDNPEWWKAPIETFKDQAEWACHKCGGAFPCYPKLSKLEIDDLSEDNLERLRLVNSPKINSGKYEIYNKGLKFGQNRKCDWYWGGD